MQPGGEELQQLERRRVAPLQVVEEDHQRGVCACLFEHGGDGVVALELHGAALARQQRRLGGEHRWGVGDDAECGTQHRQPRPQRGCRSALVAASPHGERSVGDDASHQLVGEARLADAGIAFEHHEAGVGGRLCVTGEERRQLGIAADERHGLLVLPARRLRA